MYGMLFKFCVSTPQNFTLQYKLLIDYSQNFPGCQKLLNIKIDSTVAMPTLFKLGLNFLFGNLD